MKAMILAAGLGTRLRPLTNERPKALVEVAGKTLLEITLRKLAAAGVGSVIINVHHFADKVIEFLGRKGNFGLRIEISCEDRLLDTGGGLKKAAWFFLQGDESSDEAFILHNVDVISTIDLQEMVRFHQHSAALATLAVQDRQTSRYLLFNQENQLCGRQTGPENDEELGRSDRDRALAFCGVHVISPRLLRMMHEEGAFSIIDTYLRLSGMGEKIVAFPAGRYYWRDLGKPENVVQATKDAEQNVIPI